MEFLHVQTVNDVKMSINIMHIENVYSNAAGNAVVVMLPTDGKQRTFELKQAYADLFPDTGE